LLLVPQKIYNLKFTIMNKKTNFRTLLILALVLLLGSNQNIAQNVGIGAESFTPDPSAMLDIEADNKGILVPRVDIADLSTAAPVTNPAVSLLVYNTNETTGEGFYYWSGTEWTPMGGSSGGGGERYLGEEYLGGIIYYLYLDENGEQRGLIVSKTETTAQWQSSNSTTGANRGWDGAYNTNVMTNSPARTWIDNNFNTGGLNAGANVWYLPAIDELRRIYNDRDFINKWLSNAGGTLYTTDFYWSSTEDGAHHAWVFHFSDGVAYGSSSGSSKFATQGVRAVRAF